MATVALTAARRLAILTEQIRGILEVALISGPVDANDLKALIVNRGIKPTNAELVAIRNQLVTDGIITVT